MKRIFLTYLFVLSYGLILAQYAPSANQSGTTAIYKDSFAIVAWANQVIEFNRGYQDIATPSNGLANHGDSTAALGVAEGNSSNVVSLGDNGSIVLGFPYPIKNRPGPDFAVFENSFSHDYLELAHIEVSSDGVNFVRVPSVSLTQTATQVGGFDLLDPTKIHNLAGKYIQGYGTPFDLEDIVDSSGINLDSVRFVKVIDVVGSIDSAYGTYDSQGNIINDPYITTFGSGGFDLDGVAVLNTNSALSIQDRKAIDFRVYPNPAKTQFTVNVEGIHNIKIYSMDGQLKYCQTIKSATTLSVNECNLSSGVYFIKLGDQAKRLVVH